MVNNIEIARRCFHTEMRKAQRIWEIIREVIIPEFMRDRRYIVENDYNNQTSVVFVPAPVSGKHLFTLQATHKGAAVSWGQQQKFFDIEDMVEQENLCDLLVQIMVDLAHQTGREP